MVIFRRHGPISEIQQKYAVFKLLEEDGSGPVCVWLSAGKHRARGLLESNSMVTFALYPLYDFAPWSICLQITGTD